MVGSNLDMNALRCECPDRTCVSNLIEFVFCELRSLGCDFEFAII